MPEPQSKPFSVEEINALALALNSWADTHPDADAPALSFGFFGMPLTPNQIAKVVTLYGEGEESNEGEAVIRMYRYIREEVPFSEIVESLYELSRLSDDPKDVEL